MATKKPIQLVEAPKEKAVNLFKEMEKRGLIGCIEGPADLGKNHKKYLRAGAHAGKAAA